MTRQVWFDYKESHIISYNVKITEDDIKDFIEHNLKESIYEWSDETRTIINNLTPDDIIDIEEAKKDNIELKLKGENFGLYLTDLFYNYCEQIAWNSDCDDDECFDSNGEFVISDEED